MWARTIDGRALTFHLAGIHNQNFLMRDEETGSFWQQVSGACVAGPLVGRRLDRVRSDELDLARVAREAPEAEVLLGDPDHRDRYERGWEAEIQGLPTVVDTRDSPLPPRALVVGLTVGEASRAYEAASLAREPVILDELGGVPIVLWSRGGQVLRAFERRVGDATLLLAPEDPDRLRDADTGSRWDFRGCATEGPRAGQCLAPVTVLWDYWFDWRAYNPTTSIYGREG